MSGLIGHIGLLMGASGSAPPVTNAVLEEVTQTLQPTQSTTIGAGMNGTVNAGDLLLIILTARSSSGTLTFTTPSGWTLLLDGYPNVSSLVTRTACFYKVAAGTEGGTTVNITASQSSSAAIQVFRFQAGTFNATIASGSAGGSITDTAPDPPNVAATTTGVSNFWIAGFGSNGAAAPSAWPPGYTSNQNASASGGTGCRIIACTTLSATSPQNPGPFTMGSNTFWLSFTIGISPP